MPDIVTGFVCILLVWVALEDLSRFRIRNAAVLGLMVGFVVHSVAADRASLLIPHAIFAGVGFAALFAAYSLGAIGGGDAKLLTAGLLWVGPEGAVVFALLLLAFSLAYALAAWLGWAPSKQVGQRRAVPFGPSIAVAWIGVIALMRVQ